MNQHGKMNSPAFTIMKRQEMASKYEKRPGPGAHVFALGSGGVRAWFRVRFQISGGFPVESPTSKATASKLFQGEFLCPSTVQRGFEYG